MSTKNAKEWEGGGKLDQLNGDNQLQSRGGYGETAFYFPAESGRLFGFVHEPTSAARGAGFVFCAPCFEEKLWIHRAYVSFAQELAAGGYHVLRFDFRGHGDSDGEFVDANVSTRLADLATAVGWLRQRLGPTGLINLLGLRFGASLAALYSEVHLGISRLILWDPIVSGSQYMQEVLLANVATQSAVHGRISQTRDNLVSQLKAGGVVNIEGYELDRTHFEQVSAVDLTGPKNFDGDCLIVQIAKHERQPKRKDLDALHRSYPHAEYQVTVEEPFWREIRTFYPKAANLNRVTLEWIERNGR